MIRKLLSLIAALALFSPLVLHAQVAISASDVADSFEHPIASASLCFAPVNATEAPQGFRVGSIQVVPNTVCGLVSNGVLQSGLSLAPSPTGLYYHIWAQDRKTGAVIRDWGMTPITGSNWTLDTFDQDMVVLPVTTLSMGTVTDLPPGSGGSCGISGSGPYLLNCSIPTGATGATGPPGSNSVTTSTTTSINAPLCGNGSNVAGCGSSQIQSAIGSGVYDAAGAAASAVAGSMPGNAASATLAAGVAFNNSSSNACYDVALAAGTDIVGNGTICGNPSSGVFSATQFNGNSASELINGTPQADQFPGADFCSKLAAAITYAIANNQSIVDATHFSSSQTCTTSTNPFASIATAYSTVRLTVLLPASWIKIITPWSINVSGINIIGKGPGQTWLDYTGSATSNAVNFTGSSGAYLWGDQISELSILGNSSNLTDGLFLEYAQRPIVTDVYTWGMTTAGVRTEGVVVPTFTNVHTSTNDALVYGWRSGRSTPTYAFYFDAIGGIQTTAGTVTDAISEGVSGCGWYLNSANSMTFTSGTSEDNGCGLYTGTGSTYNTFIGSDFEGNTNNSSGNDVQDNGSSDYFRNIIASSTCTTPCTNSVVLTGNWSFVEGGYLPSAWGGSGANVFRFGNTFATPITFQAGITSDGGISHTASNEGVSTDAFFFNSTQVGAMYAIGPASPVTAWPNDSTVIEGNTSGGLVLSTLTTAPVRITTNRTFTFSFDSNGYETVPMAIVVGGAAPTVSSGQVGYGSTTAAASSCGSLSGAAGCLIVNIGGTAHYVPYW